MLNKDNYCVIMSGGQGTRLWPLSRRDMPKQFIDFNHDGQTLLCRTMERMRKIFPEENIIVSTNFIYYPIVREQLPTLNPLQILKEPIMKGTAPSLMLAAYHIKAINPNASILAMPSDLEIEEEEPLRQVVEKGMAFVSTHDNLLTLGIKPTYPETNFGYIQIEDTTLDGMHKVRTFTEKPAKEFAKVFVESGEFYWNSGLLMLSVKTFLETAKIYLPDLNNQFEQIFTANSTLDARRSVLYSVYESFPMISIDKMLLEKTDNIYMATCSFAWTDIESWGILYEYYGKDEKSNVILADNHNVYRSEGNIIIETDHKKLVVADDLNQYLVVDTPDVLLICHRDNEKEIRKYVNDALIKWGDKFI